MSCTLGSSYTVKAGDTLYLIAQRELSNGDRWREIMKPNGCLLYTSPSPRDS